MAFSPLLCLKGVGGHIGGFVQLPWPLGFSGVLKVFDGVLENLFRFEFFDSSLSVDLKGVGGQRVGAAESDLFPDGLKDPS